jgi:hypothetical protein
MIYYIYKIVCEDTSVNYTYVGSTRAFKERKYHHKSQCNNENYKHYNCKLYKTIRENGGWNNFRMVCIDEIEVDSNRKAEAKEEEHRLKLQANLNERRCHTTAEQKKEQQRECNKEYYKNNTEKIKQQRKEYQKEYRETNTEQIKEWCKTKCKCECGGTYTNAGKSQHIKSKKHKKYLEQIKDI